MKQKLKYLEDYFGKRLKTYKKEDFGHGVVNQLSTVNKKILFDIGIPVYNGLGGKYEPIPTTAVFKEKFLPL